ncbi:hypothetical protein BDR07DRAFT_1422332 [Suillus spraguei]|nr:hypothetical protein BDR07DRAFT_1422332 [Suillus spraguei]
MRFSSAIIFTVVAALASSISAMPADTADAAADKCPLMCLSDKHCSSMNCDFQECVSISSFPELYNNITHLHGRSIFSAPE